MGCSPLKKFTERDGIVVDRIVRDGKECHGCVEPARKEFMAEFMPWFDGMNTRAKDLGITIHGSSSYPAEHTYNFILDAKDYRSITAFFAGIMPENHNRSDFTRKYPAGKCRHLVRKQITDRIRPVMT